MPECYRDAGALGPSLQLSCKFVIISKEECNSTEKRGLQGRGSSQMRAEKWLFCWLYKTEAPVLFERWEQKSKHRGLEQ